MTPHTGQTTPLGRAKRAPNLDQVAECRFFGTEHHAAAITSLVLSAGDVFGVPPTVHRTLVYLVHQVHTDEWRHARPIYRASNERIARRLGVDERTVRMHLQQLEAAGWLIRRYTVSNSRVGAGGIDLSPLGARLAELEAAASAIDDAIHARRLEEQRTAREESSIHHTSTYTSSSAESVEPGGTEVRAEGRGQSLAAPARFRPNPHRAQPPRDPAAVRNLLAKLSDRFAAALGQAADDPDVRPDDLARAASVLGESLGVPKHVLSDGLRRHGPLVFAAILVDVTVRQNVRQRVGYARALLTMPAADLDIWASIYKLGRVVDQLAGETPPASAPPAPITGPSEPPPADPVRARIFAIVGAPAYRSWFEHAGVRLEASELIVTTRSQFAADRIEEKFADELRARMNLEVRVDVQLAS